MSHEPHHHGSLVASAKASTSKLPIHSNLPDRPRPSGDSLKQQDDFISFAEILGDEARPPRRNGYLNKGKKRSIGEVLQDKGKRKLRDVEKTTPWTAEINWDQYGSATEQLSAEIKAFAGYIAPTDQEHELRTCVIESVRRLITKRWRDARVVPFGSFETRLYLPTGDIDLVVIASSIPNIKALQKRVLYAISGLLTSSGIGQDIVVIAKAKVPIVKFVSVLGGFKIDISLNMMNGISVGARVLQLFKEVGENSARSLVLVIKAFLSQRNMNEVYSGGLGSYSIICLVVSFLQLHPKLQRKELIAYDNLGTLLLEFLEVYGKNFNYDDVGVCLAGGGSYYSKSRRGWFRSNQPYLLSIEDPADPTNDVAGGSHNIISVRQSLAGAFEVLTASVYYRTSIILARIAAVQSGVTLSTLSGRAIPHATGEEGGDIDECRKSLLGAILGVTTEIEYSRNNLQTLYHIGEAENALGILPEKFSVDGMKIDSGVASIDGPSVIPNAQKDQASNCSKAATQPPAVKSNGVDTLLARSYRDQTSPHAAARTDANNKTIDLSSVSPPPPKIRVGPGKTYIDLDSPSPEHDPDTGHSGNTSINHQDSGYSVQKGKKSYSFDPIKYAMPDSSESEMEEGQISSNESKRSEIRVSPSKITSKRPSNGKERKAQSRTQSASRSRVQLSANPEKAGSDVNFESKHRTLSAISSDMQVESSSTASSQLSVTDRRKSKSINGKDSQSKLAQQKRNDYWSSKAPPKPSVTTSEDDDDVVWVKSR